MGLNWPELIRQRNEWVAHNFPTAGQPEESIMGCVEEVGELAHAHLKEIQNIRGSAHEHQAAGKDSIGDLMVYLMGVMNHSYHPPASFQAMSGGPSDPDQALFYVAGAVGALCRHHVYGWGGIDLCIDKITYFAEEYCRLRGWDFDDIVQTTWDAVRKRDWIAYPDTGLPPSPPVDLYAPDHLTADEQAVGADGK